MVLKNITGGFNCALENYGNMRDTIGCFSYKFKSGIYVLEGDCATGGWALSTVLAGKDKFMKGEVWIDNNLISVDELKKYTCYVGEDAGLRKFLGVKSMTVAEQIQYGIKKGFSYCDNIEDLKSKFGLSSGRFNRQIKYCSGERWRVSMAIGYAMGKSIYCFPWVNKRLVNSLSDCLKTCFTLLLEKGAIIIVPTSDHTVLNQFAEKIAIINMEH